MALAIPDHEALHRSPAVQRRRLAEMVQAIEERGCHRSGYGRDGRLVATGWKQVDLWLCPLSKQVSVNGQHHRPVGGLRAGVIHEWFGVADELETGHKSSVISGSHPGVGRGSREAWTPPLMVLAHLAKRAHRDACCRGGGKVVWIGRRCWPYPAARVLGDSMRGGLLNDYLFIDPPNIGARLWAIDLCLRSHAVATVVADASGLGIAATRRLQLAAESGRSLALLARPSWELRELSAATTRWRVRWEPTSIQRGEPRWTLELLRCKAGQPMTRARQDETLHWTVQWDRDQGVVALPADVVDRPAQTTGSKTPTEQDPSLKIAAAG